MILFAILLSSGLDMSLPEFEPDLDLSGNYIVSDYDVSSDEFIAVEMTTEEASEAGIIPAELPKEEVLLAEPALRTAVDVSSFSKLETYSIHLKLDSENHIIEHVGVDTDPVYIYVVLQPNVTYYIDTDAPRLIYTSNFEVNNSYTSTTDSTFTSSSLTYGFVLNTRYLNVYYDSSSGGGSGGESGGDVSGGSIDFTAVVNAINVMHDEIYMQNRIIIFILFISFAYPLVIGSFKNFFGGKKDV